MIKIKGISLEHKSEIKELEEGTILLDYSNPDKIIELNKEDRKLIEAELW